jgi:hypothetical protein
MNEVELLDDLCRLLREGLVELHVDDVDEVPRFQVTPRGFAISQSPAEPADTHAVDPSVADPGRPAPARRTVLSEMYFHGHSLS